VYVVYIAKLFNLYTPYSIISAKAHSFTLKNYIQTKGVLGNISARFCEHWAEKEPSRAQKVVFK